MVKGSCYCGDIEFELDQDQLNGVSCHCKTCQKLHSVGSYNIQSEQSKLRVTKGTPKIYDDNKTDSGKTIHRNFCGKCGSALFSDPDSIPGVRFVKVGALENAKDVKLAAEIYVNTALPHTVQSKDKFGQKHFEGMMAKEV